MPSSIPERRGHRRRRLSLAWLVVLATPTALVAQDPAPAPAVPAAATCEVRVTPDSTPAGRPGGVLRGGDLLKIVVFRNKELTGDYIIDAQGRLVIPGLGVFDAAGLTPRQVEDGLRQLLACQGIRPDVSVQAQIRVSVLGEVRNPGVFPVDPGVTLLQLLTAAGGETPRADLSHARVIRSGRNYPVNLQAALSGSPSGSIVLNSNDVLIVPKKNGLTREDASLFIGLVSALITAANLVVTLSK